LTLHNAKGFCVPLLGAAIIVLLLCFTEIARFPRLHNRHVEYVTSLGGGLSHFYDGLAPNPSVIAHLRNNSVSLPRPACLSRPSAASRVMNALGIGEVVHAQNSCNTACVQACFYVLLPFGCSLDGECGYVGENDSEAPYSDINPQSYQANGPCCQSGMTANCDYEYCGCGY
jgi:hypothetical protein